MWRHLHGSLQRLTEMNSLITHCMILSISLLKSVNFTISFFLVSPWWWLTNWLMMSCLCLTRTSIPSSVAIRSSCGVMRRYMIGSGSGTITGPTMAATAAEAFRRGGADVDEDVEVALTWGAMSSSSKLLLLLLLRSSTQEDDEDEEEERGGDELQDIFASLYVLQPHCHHVPVTTLFQARALSSSDTMQIQMPSLFDTLLRKLKINAVAHYRAYIADNTATTKSPIQKTI
jgi:hypothetical protein